MAQFGNEGVSEMSVPRLSQEALAEMVRTTRSRVYFFMNRFRKLGFIYYDPGNNLHLRSSLLNVVLRDEDGESTTLAARNPTHTRRRFQNHTAGYSTGIVPSDPPWLEPKAGVNKALFSMTPAKLSPKGLALQKAGWNLARVLWHPRSERDRTLAQICLDTLVAKRWMPRLAERKFDLRSPDLRANIPQFYSDLSLPIDMMKDQVRWRVVLSELDHLKAVAQSSAIGPAR